MKKILAVIAVLAITLISSVALAEVTVSGSIDTRARAFNNIGDFNSDVADYNRDTQTRVRINFDGKAGDAKAKVTVEKDFETWGKTATGDVEVVNGALSDIREAWIDTGLFGPVRLKGGHMLAQLGNGWFVRSMKFGSDAWIAYADIGPMHMGLVNVKIAEVARDGDADLYSAVVTAKLSDTMTVGGNLTKIRWSRPFSTVVGGVVIPTGADTTNNIGVHADLGLGPVKLKVEVDTQMGSDNTTCGTLPGDQCADYKGNQIVIEGGLAAGPVNINFTAARGTGNEVRQNMVLVGGVATPVIGSYVEGADVKEFVNVMDADPHTSFLYEYKFGQPGLNGVGAHRGYANLTALSVGADAKLGAVNVGGSIWWLAATEDVLILNNQFGAVVGGVATPLARAESDLGLELDVRVGVKLSDAVSWNTTLGYFMPGDAYTQVDTVSSAVLGYTVTKDPDEATGIQSVLSMKF